MSEVAAISVLGNEDAAEALVAVISWEDRFILGLERLLERHKVNSALLLRYEEWADWSEEAAGVARSLCQEHEVACEQVLVSHRRQEHAWLELRQRLPLIVPNGGDVLVDISTMPRETIWTVFFLLQELCNARVAYAYHRPQDYPSKWLSRNPDRPRLVLQLSGTTRFGRPTILLVTTGFDPSRTEQLMRTFEPSLTLMALQEGEQFRNMVLNVEPHQTLERAFGSRLHDRHLIQSFVIDAYSEDHGRKILQEHLSPYLGDSNVVMTSLGPKLSAVALYAIQRDHPETALVYAPSREYSRNYSLGIESTIYGRLDESSIVASETALSR